MKWSRYISRNISSKKGACKERESSQPPPFKKRSSTPVLEARPMRKRRNFDLLHIQVSPISTPWNNNSIETYVPISETGLQCDYDSVRCRNGRLTASGEKTQNQRYTNCRSIARPGQQICAADLRKWGSLWASLSQHAQKGFYSSTFSFPFSLNINESSSNSLK